MTRRAGVGVHMESLERLLMYAADPVISEFMAKNSGTLLDGYGNDSDWIEIYNQGDAPAQLQGWHLTDDLGTPAKWTFPSKTLAPGARLVVFASGKDTTDPAGNLHTSFSLSDDGERLALIKPDLTVVSSFSATGNYPAQFADVSYGIGKIYANTPLLATGAPLKAFIPTNGSIDNGTWVTPSFDDAGWISGNTSVGFDTGAFEDNTALPAVKANWDADSISGVANNGRVASWSSGVGSATAVASGNPIYRTNQINGHAAIQFKPSDGTDNLRVASAQNPLSAANDFTLAVVFRATSGTGTVNTSTTNYNGHAGIVDGDLGAGYNDWGTSIAATGQVAAGTGSPSRTDYSASGVNYADGAAHVLLFSRQAGVLTLYVDGGDGVSRADGSTATRVVGDMVFGSSQLNNTLPLTGDIAQVIVYGGAVNAARAFDAAAMLGAKYGITVAAPTIVNAAPTIVADWSADALNGALADNGAVTSWASTANGVTRNAAASGGPSLRKNQLNGHSVVRFDPSNGNDQIRVAAAVNPVAGASDFTVAYVFRTSTAGKGTATDWYDNTGIVDAEQAGATNDWGTAIDSTGRIAGGIGNPDDTIYSQTGLNDGRPHVVVYSKSGGTVRLSIDGGPAQAISAGTAVRNSADMVFGSIQTNVQDSYFTGDLAEVRVYNAGFDSDTMRGIASPLASTYGITLAPTAYAPLINTDLQSAMAGLASTAAVRYPFTVAGDPSRFDRLLLNVQYDDGFVAYLNGTELARRNAPGGAITYTSTSTTQRLDSDALTPESIDLSDYIGLLNGNGQPNVLAFRLLNRSAGDSDLLLVPTLTAGSSTTGEAYFGTPTPGTANAEGFFGKLASPTFSKQHGYYSGTQSVSISAAIPGATIIYTLDGSEPRPTHGIVVNAATPTSLAVATLSINATTTLRAISVKDAYLPSAVSAATYIYSTSVATQQNTAPPGAYWNTAVDPRVVNQQVPDQGYTFAQALTSIPSISLTMDWNELFGTGGLYQNPTQKGDAWERQTSIEYFDPRNAADAGFSVNAGIRMQGGAGRSTGHPKQSFRIYFRSEYGLSTLNYPLWGANAPATSAGKFVLRAFNNFSWAADNNGTSDFIHDMYGRMLLGQQTGSQADAVQGTFVNLYIDGQFWGLYTLDEDPDDDWAAAHFGGSKDDYEVVEPAADSTGGIELKTDLPAGRTTSLYSDLFTAFNAAFSDSSISNAEYDALSRKVDYDNLIDYMINDIWRGDNDSPVVITNRNDPRNFYAYANYADGKYKFAVWDAELSMDDVNRDRTEVSNTTTTSGTPSTTYSTTNGGHDGPGRLWIMLRTNSEFRQKVADHIQKLFHNGGALQVENGVNNPLAYYNTFVPQIDAAIVGESARWGTAHQSYPRLRVSDWTNAVAGKRTYLAGRTAVVLGQLAADFPMISVAVPTFKVGSTTQRGGKVAAGTAIVLADGNSSTTGDQIYYTLDGSDPRLAGGAVSGSAVLYAGPITLSASKTITVRILKNGTTWSPLDKASFSVDAAANASNLAVTELHYHPTNVTAAELAINPAWTEDDFEYVELMNTSASTVTLAGLTFTAGITGTMADASVAPGERVVVARNVAAFRARFGNGPRLVLTSTGTTGGYGGSFSNSGETVTLKAADGSIIKSFTYTDGSANDGWPVRADGDGSSLEVVSLTGDYNSPANWRPSYAYDGTPSAAPTVSPAADVVINEIVSAAADSVDHVELYNRSNATLDIGGWYLSDSGGVDWMIPTGTTIAAGGYVVFDSNDWSSAATHFGISGANGGNLYLVRSTAGTSAPIGFADAQSFGASAVGESFSRVPNGTGELYPSATPTLGAANAGPRIGPATITEVMYNPNGGTLNLEYIEVQNQTNVALDISGWKLTNGVSFTAPSGTTLGAYEPVLFVHFNPATDTAAANAFRSAYGLAASVQLIGLWTGDLADAGEHLTLVRPDAPQASEPGITPLVTVDDFTYGAGSPWPAVAPGQALTRLSNKVYGRDPTDWTAAAPTAGVVSYGNAYFTNGGTRTLNGTTSFESLTVTGGTTLAVGRDGVLRTGSLSLLNGGEIDLGSGTLLIDYAPGNSPLTTVAALLATGRAGGSWTGAGGVRSSAAAGTNDHVLGYGEASAIPATTRATFADSPIDDTTVVVRFTHAGDVDLNRTVDFSDLLTLAKNYGKTGKTFAEGNLDFDAAGNVDFSDLLALAKAYGKSAVLPAALPQSEVAASDGNVPARRRPAASVIG